MCGQCSSQLLEGRELCRASCDPLPGEGLSDSGQHCSEHSIAVLPALHQQSQQHWHVLTSKDGRRRMPDQGVLVIDILISENSTQEAQFKCTVYLSRCFSIFSATAGAVSFLNMTIPQWSEAAHTHTLPEWFPVNLFSELQFTLVYKRPIFPNFHTHRVCSPSRKPTFLKLN